MSALKYWIWLAQARSVGPEAVRALINALGSPENVYFADGDSLRAAAAISEAALGELADKSLDRAERVLERCEASNTSVITMQDTCYPDRLKNISAPPAVLYIKGALPLIDEEPALAVVGTRTATPYGLSAALDLCYRLAKAGVLIVSGMAKGIDAAAHTGALQAGAPTVAVFGCGPDIVYPAENRQLYQDILTHGAGISEYPPGTPVQGQNFPARNRIISALCLGTLIIEAPRGSGALITASCALEQGRDVFAVPGNIDVAANGGAHGLIKAGAMLVSEPLDVLEEYCGLFPSKIKLPSSPVKRPPPPSGLTDKKPEEKPEKSVRSMDMTALLQNRSQLQQRLLLAVAGQPRHVDAIIESTGESARQVLGELTMLELEGLVRQLPGKRFELAAEFE